jgi:hypothetical protein
MNETYREPEAALQFLGPVHPLIFRALEQATEHARIYFESHDLAVDPYLFSALVRYHCRRKLLEAQGQVADLVVNRLQNIGTEISYRGVHIRLWKASDDGHLPPPGASAAKQAFYHQPFLPGMEEPAGTRLAVIWEIDASLGLADVTLVCPKGVSEPWEPGEEHWRVPLPHPAVSVSAQAPARPAATELELDLDLELDQTGEQDNG